MADPKGQAFKQEKIMTHFNVQIDGMTFLAPEAPEVLAWTAQFRCIYSGTGHRPNKLPRRSETRFGPYSAAFLSENRNPEKYDPMGLYDTNAWSAAVVFAAVQLANAEADAVIAGGAIGWDQILAEAAIMLGLPLMVAVPFQTQDGMWPTGVKKLWRRQLRAADLVVSVTDINAITLPEARSPRDLDMPKMKDAMRARNLFMVKRAQTVLALWDGTSGGTGNCIRDCQNEKRPYVNVWKAFNAEMLDPAATRPARTPNAPSSSRPAAPLFDGAGNEAIRGFQGEYRWLSNFIPGHPILMGGIHFATVEQAYQAAKTLDTEMRRKIAAMDAGQAKRAGRSVTLRSDWETIKETVMVKLVETKFKHPVLRAQLLATGTAPIIEENTWHDTYWGVCNGKGQNRLGEILMALRSRLQASETARTTQPAA